MQKLDGEIKEVNGWIDGAERKMDEMDSQGPNDAALKVVISVSIYVCHMLFFAVLQQKMKLCVSASGRCCVPSWI